MTLSLLLANVLLVMVRELLTMRKKNMSRNKREGRYAGKMWRGAVKKQHTREGADQFYEALKWKFFYANCK